jgi:hypothetical protein
MRSQVHKLKRAGIRFTIDQHEIWTYVAVAKIGPFASEGVVPEAHR